MSNERDELALILVNSQRARYSLPPRTTTEQCSASCWAEADAVLAAGYRKPRTITTVEELAALPEGVILRANHGGVWTRIIDGPGAVWRCTGYRNHYRTDEIELPAIVLCEPEHAS